MDIDYEERGLGHVVAAVIIKRDTADGGNEPLGCFVGDVMRREHANHVVALRRKYDAHVMAGFPQEAGLVRDQPARW